MSLGIACRAFFAALFDREAAKRIRNAMDSTEIPATAPLPTPSAASGEAPEKKLAKSSRSDALTLLSTLQREARLLDLIQEPLDQYQDAQIGAAAREVLKDSRQTLERMFGIAPLAEEEEGASVAIQPGTSANRMRLLGKSEGKTGTLTHRGWQATSCDIPQWSGGKSEAWILSPTEIEVN